MPKHLIKRITPDHDKIKNHKHLRVFGELLHDPNLWHMNRRSVAGAFGAGLFWAFIPIPLQMLASGITAIFCRINLPISVGLVWISNPITIPPMFYSCYLVGSWLMGISPEVESFEVSAEWMSEMISVIWKPLFLGSFFMATISASLGYVGMRLFWRWYMIRKYLHKSHCQKSDKIPSES